MAEREKKLQKSKVKRLMKFNMRLITRSQLPVVSSDQADWWPIGSDHTDFVQPIQNLQASVMLTDLHDLMFLSFPPQSHNIHNNWTPKGFYKSQHSERVSDAE